MENYANSLEYKKYLEQFNYIFRKTYYKNDNKIILYNNYNLSIKKYNHIYTIGKNYKKSVDCFEINLKKYNEIIFKTRTVFGIPFFQYIKHKNNNEYFICGNDLLDFLVYNITKNEEYKYVNEYMINDNYEGNCNNEFLYITEWKYNKNNNFVAINGYDGYSNIITIGDFSKPEKLPYNFQWLSPKEYGFENCTAIGWLEDNNLSVLTDGSKSIIITKNEIKNILKNNR